MSASMAEVVRLHSQIGRDEKGQYCTYCNHRYGYAAEHTLHRQASAHVAEQLAANGYGKLEDASRELKFLRGERKTLGKELDHFESQRHATVTIKYLRRFLGRMPA